MGLLACFLPDCAGHDEQFDAIQHGLQHLLAEVADVKRIQRLILAKEGLIMNDIHSEIAEALQPVVDAVSTVSTDVAQALVDFGNTLAPRLSDAEKAQFAGLASSLLNLDATVKNADPGAGTPATPTDPTTPVDGTADAGSDNGSTPSA